MLYCFLFFQALFLFTPTFIIEPKSIGYDEAVAFEPYRQAMAKRMKVV